MKRIHSIWLASILVATSVVTDARATSTLYRVRVGGDNSYSSEGFNDPGRLSDGVTVGTADLYFILDDKESELTVIVINTSPVLEDVCNPVISSFYFNAPAAITAMSLASQSAAGGPAPAFTATFDANVNANPQPNGAGGFGGFSIGMQHAMGIAGSIANANADTLPGPANSMVIGPAIFVYDLKGDLTGLTAAEFGRAFSGTPPGNMPAQVVAHFQGGGDECSASAFISTPIEDCFLVVGRGAVDGSFVSPYSGHYFDLQIPSVTAQYGIVLTTPARIEVTPYVRPSQGFRWRPSGAVGAGVRRVTSFEAQTLMWNPNFDSQDPEKSSHGVHVDLWSDGSYSFYSFGAVDGMTLSVSSFTLSDGRVYLTFPFTVDGMSPP